MVKYGEIDLREIGDSVGEPARCIQKTSKVNQPQIFCMFADPKHPHSAFFAGSKSKHLLPALLLVPASPFSQKIDDFSYGHGY